MKINLDKKAYDDNEYFVRIYRHLVSDYLNEKKVNLDEFFLLIWLHLRANPFNGVVNTSYDSLRMELSGKHSKNEINKICLNLKHKKFIYFKKQQGRRSSFDILIANYPLVCGSLKKIPELDETDVRSKNYQNTNIPAEVTTNAEPQKQKLKRQKSVEDAEETEFDELEVCRSTNIENDTNKNNYNNNADYYTRLETNEPQENRICIEVAKFLELENPEQVLRLRDAYGINIVIDCYEEVQNIQCQNNGIKNPASYFFSRVNKLLKNNSP